MRAMAGRRFPLLAALLLASLGASQPAGAACAPARGAAGMHEADVLYLPTPQPVVDAMLRLAGVSGSDVVYDLGSGDGRIPIAAARDHGARGVGIELDGRMIEQARCQARAAGMEHLVEFRQEDLFGAELGKATVVTLFLFPEINRRLGPKLFSELRPGTRIVSHRFGIGDRAPERIVEFAGHQLLLWTVP